MTDRNHKDLNDTDPQHKGVAAEQDSSKAKPYSIIQSIESYLGGPPSLYKSYFDLEGGTFPDLFSRDLEPAKDRKKKNRRSDETVTLSDCESRTKKIASNRGSRLYSDLLVAAMEKKLRSVEPKKVPRVDNKPPTQEAINKAAVDMVAELLEKMGVAVNAATIQVVSSTEAKEAKLGGEVKEEKAIEEEEAPDSKSKKTGEEK